MSKKADTKKKERKKERNKESFKNLSWKFLSIQHQINFWKNNKTKNT